MSRFIWQPGEVEVIDATKKPGDVIIRPSTQEEINQADANVKAAENLPGGRMNFEQDGAQRQNHAEVAASDAGLKAGQDRQHSNEKLTQ